MKKLLSLISIFLLSFSFFTTSVFADGFTNSGDNEQNLFYSTIAYSIDSLSLPESSSSHGGIEYDLANVVGSMTGQVHWDLWMLKEPGYPFRKGTDGTYVAVPPGSVVDVTYFYSNQTGHTVFIPEVDVAYTRNEPVEESFFTNFASFENGEGDLNSLDLLNMGQTVIRNGVLRRYSGVGNVEYTHHGKMHLDKLHVKNPIYLIDAFAQEEGDSYQVSVRLRNVGSDKLNRVYLRHKDFFGVASLEPQEDANFIYYLPKENIEEDGTFGSFTVEVPDSSKRCSVFGNNFSYNFNIDSVSVFSARMDGGLVSGWMLAEPKEAFCIERIPFKMTSSPVMLVEEGDNSNVEELSPEVEEESEQENVLNEDKKILGISSSLKELPKTGIDNTYLIYPTLLLLVVDIFLWYSVLRKRFKKRIYGSRNIFTKLCTKSSKNSVKGRI